MQSRGRTWFGIVSGAHLLMACCTRELWPDFSLLNLLLCAELSLSRLLDEEERLLDTESPLLFSCLSLWALSGPFSWLDFSVFFTVLCGLFDECLCRVSTSFSRLPVRFLSELDDDADDASRDFELSRRTWGFCELYLGFDSCLFAFLEVFSVLTAGVGGWPSGLGKSGGAVLPTPGVEGLRSTPIKLLPITLCTALWSPRIPAMCFVSLLAGTYIQERKNDVFIY